MVSSKMKGSNSSTFHTYELAFCKWPFWDFYKLTTWDSSEVKATGLTGSTGRHEKLRHVGHVQLIPGVDPKTFLWTDFLRQSKACKCEFCTFKARIFNFQGIQKWTGHGQSNQKWRFFAKNATIFGSFPTKSQKYFSPNYWNLAYSTAKILILAIFGTFWPLLGRQIW